MRADTRDILAWTTTRGALRSLAHTIMGLEKGEAYRVIATLIGELEALRDGDTSAEIWRQATQFVTTPVQVYSLERIGLWNKEWNADDG